MSNVAWRRVLPLDTHRWADAAVTLRMINTPTTRTTTMNTFEHEDELSTQDELAARRDIIRHSLDEIASEVGMALRDVGLNFPVFLTVPNSGHSFATIATALDPSDADWQRASEIACQIIAQKVGYDRLRARELTCAVANSTVAVADVISY